MLNLFIKKLFSLSRISKIIIQILSDCILILGSFVLSIYLRLEDISYFDNNYNAFVKWWDAVVVPTVNEFYTIYQNQINGK